MWKTQWNCICGNQHNIVIEKEDYIMVGEPLVFVCPIINKRIMFANNAAWTEEFKFEDGDLKVVELKRN